VLSGGGGDDNARVPPVLSKLALPGIQCGPALVRTRAQRYQQTNHASGDEPDESVLPVGLFVSMDGVA